MRRVFTRTFAAVAIVVPLGLALAAPVTNVSPKLHPNLRAAQDFMLQAYKKLDTAQVANRYQLGGHGDKAKKLLEEAAAECKLAAETANGNK